eukprot:g3630.t1
MTTREIIVAKNLVVSPDIVYSPGAVEFDTESGLVCEVRKLKDDPLLNDATRTVAEWIVPGFIDIHNHGFGGAENVIDYWSCPRYTLSRMPAFGVTATLATLTFPSPPLLQRSLKACDAVNKIVGSLNPNSAVVYGIHAEGPIIATRGGLPNSQMILRWDIDKFRTLLDNIGPYLRIMTISPSVESGASLSDDAPSSSSSSCDMTCFTCDATIENIDAKSLRPINSFVPFARIKELLRRGIVPSLGHDKEAPIKDIVDCLRCGKEATTTDDRNTSTAREDWMSLLRIRRPLQGPMHMTHVFNVMRFHHRTCGLANIAMCRKFPVFDRRFQGLKTVPTVEVILDTQHVDALTVQSLFDARGVGHSSVDCPPFTGKHSVAIISDAIAGPNAAVGTKLLYGSARAAWVQDANREGIRGKRQRRDRTGVKRKQVVDENGVLCGSCEAIGPSFQRLVRVFGLSVPEASRLCSLNPARIARISHVVGTLEPGKRADIVVLDSEMGVVSTLVWGRVAFEVK